MTDLDDGTWDAPKPADYFTTDNECWAWKKAPRIIGGTSHTHVCRQDTGHEGVHVCHACQATWGTAT